MCGSRPTAAPLPSKPHAPIGTRIVSAATFGCIATSQAAPGRSCNSPNPGTTANRNFRPTAAGSPSSPIAAHNPNPESAAASGGIRKVSPGLCHFSERRRAVSRHPKRGRSARLSPGRPIRARFISLRASGPRTSRRPTRRTGKMSLSSANPSAATPFTASKSQKREVASPKAPPKPATFPRAPSS
jgi:hypothetical protein